MATLRPTPTLTRMPKNLTLVVATPKRLGTLQVVIIINHLALKEFRLLKAYRSYLLDGGGNLQVVNKYGHTTFWF